eukprot:scaffold164_cov409-Prasinococcus_capsulatus_cf.AAC.3
MSAHEEYVKVRMDWGPCCHTFSASARSITAASGVSMAWYSTFALVSSASRSRNAPCSGSHSPQSHQTRGRAADTHSYPSGQGTGSVVISSPPRAWLRVHESKYPTTKAASLTCNAILVECRRALPQAKVSRDVAPGLFLAPYPVTRPQKWCARAWGARGRLGEGAEPGMSERICAAKQTRRTTGPARMRARQEAVLAPEVEAARATNWRTNRRGCAAAIKAAGTERGRPSDTECEVPRAGTRALILY